MKDKLIKIMSICLVLSFLTGCWDQKMLKDTMFLSTVAYEKRKEIRCFLLLLSAHIRLKKGF